MWRALVVVAALGGVASADDERCGRASESSLLDNETDVPINAHVIVARNSSFHLRGYQPEIPAHPLAGTELVEVDPGMLSPHTHYVVLDYAGGPRVADFTTGASLDLVAPLAPDASWSSDRFWGVTVRVDRASDVVAYIATLLGPREQQSYLVRIHDRVSGSALLTQPCLARAGVAVGDHACFDLVAIDRGGLRSPPARVCGVLGEALIADAIDLVIDTQTVQPTFQRRQYGSSPWPIFAAIALTIFGWGRLRRMHALRRYRHGSLVEADRAATLRALARLRVMLLGFTSGCFLSFTVAGAMFDLTERPGAWFAIAFVSATVISARATWRVHAAWRWLQDPAGVAAIDPSGYLFASRGHDGPTAVPMRRATLAELAIELPAARVVRQ